MFDFTGHTDGVFIKYRLLTLFYYEWVMFSWLSTLNMSYIFLVVETQRPWLFKALVILHCKTAVLLIHQSHPTSAKQKKLHIQLKWLLTSLQYRDTMLILLSDGNTDVVEYDPYIQLYVCSGGLRNCVLTDCNAVEYAQTLSLQLDQHNHHMQLTL